MPDNPKDRSTPGRRDAHDAVPPRTEAGKGHATPKRREAQAAKKRPLVPADRRAAAKASKEKQRADRARMHQAMLTGDERFLPPRDRGPIRRYVRAYVDARWSVGEFFLPASLAIVLVVLLAGNRPVFAVTAILGIYLVILVSIIDAVVLTRILKRRITAKFGDLPKGTLMYAAMRAFQIRRTRMPRPMVKRGEYPV